MSITCELTSKKAEESSGGVKWIKKHLFFMILCCLTTSLVIVILMSSGKEEETGSCNGEGRVLYRHQNVTRSEIHDLVSLFSDSDQVNNPNWLWFEIVLY